MEQYDVLVTVHCIGASVILTKLATIIKVKVNKEAIPRLLFIGYNKYTVIKIPNIDSSINELFKGTTW